jgi:hypothetical protein
VVLALHRRGLLLQVVRFNLKPSPQTVHGRHRLVLRKFARLFLGAVAATLAQAAVLNQVVLGDMP